MAEEPDKTLTSADTMDRVAKDAAKSLAKAMMDAAVKENKWKAGAERTPANVIIQTKLQEAMEKAITGIMTDKAKAAEFELLSPKEKAEKIVKAVKEDKGVKDAWPEPPAPTVFDMIKDPLSKPAKIVREESWKKIGEGLEKELTNDNIKNKIDTGIYNNLGKELKVNFDKVMAKADVTNDLPATTLAKAASAPLEPVAKDAVDAVHKHVPSGASKDEEGKPGSGQARVTDAETKLQEAITRKTAELTAGSGKEDFLKKKPAEQAKEVMDKVQADPVGKEALRVLGNGDRDAKNKQLEGATKALEADLAKDDVKKNIKDAAEKAPSQFKTMKAAESLAKSFGETLDKEVKDGLVNGTGYADKGRAQANANTIANYPALKKELQEAMVKTAADLTKDPETSKKFLAADKNEQAKMIIDAMKEDARNNELVTKLAGGPATKTKDKDGKEVTYDRSDKIWNSLKEDVAANLGKNPAKDAFIAVKTEREAEFKKGVEGVFDTVAKQTEANFARNPLIDIAKKTKLGTAEEKDASFKEMSDTLKAAQEKAAIALATDKDPKKVEEFLKKKPEDQARDIMAKAKEDDKDGKIKAAVDKFTGGDPAKTNAVLKVAEKSLEYGLTTNKDRVDSIAKGNPMGAGPAVDKASQDVPKETTGIARYDDAIARNKEAINILGTIQEIRKNPPPTAEQIKGARDSLTKMDIPPGVRNMKPEDIAKNPEIAKAQDSVLNNVANANPPDVLEKNLKFYKVAAAVNEAYGNYKADAQKAGIPAQTEAQFLRAAGVPDKEFRADKQGNVTYFKPSDKSLEKLAIASKKMTDARDPDEKKAAEMGWKTEKAEAAIKTFGAEAKDVTAALTTKFPLSKGDSHDGERAALEKAVVDTTARLVSTSKAYQDAPTPEDKAKVVVAALKADPAAQGALNKLVGKDNVGEAWKTIEATIAKDTAKDAEAAKAYGDKTKGPIVVVAAKTQEALSSVGKEVTDQFPIPRDAANKIALKEDMAKAVTAILNGPGKEAFLKEPNSAVKADLIMAEMAKDPRAKTTLDNLSKGLSGIVGEVDSRKLVKDSLTSALDKGGDGLTKKLDDLTKPPPEPAAKRTAVAPAKAAEDVAKGINAAVDARDKDKLPAEKASPEAKEALVKAMKDAVKDIATDPATKAAWEAAKTPEAQMKVVLDVLQKNKEVQDAVKAVAKSSEVKLEVVAEKPKGPPVTVSPPVDAKPTWAKGSNAENAVAANTKEGGEVPGSQQMVKLNLTEAKGVEAPAPGMTATQATGASR